MALSRRLLAALAVLGVTAACTLAQQPTAPDAAFTTLDGRQIRLQDLRGKVVGVTFWATSCPICLGEMPDLVKTYQQYRFRGFELIAVAMAYDAPDHVRDYAQGRGLPFPVALDTDGKLARMFGDTQVVPTTFLIDKEGKVVSRTLGAIDFSKLRQYLDASLGT